MPDIYKESLKLHKKHGGKISTTPLFEVRDRHDLSLAYTPGVAEASRQIAKNKDLSYDLTMRGRTVAVVSDGSAVLGLGNIGPEAAMPVMEGKSLLLKKFGGVDSVPIVINTQETNEIIRFVKTISPTFAGINLEDISAPRCFEIEDQLQDIGIPVFHDDQHGTAIVVTAALKNAAIVAGKEYRSLKVVVVGAGAAGLAITKMLLNIDGSLGKFKKLKGESVFDVVVVDSVSAITKKRKDLNDYKKAIAAVSNVSQKDGQLADTLEGSDAVIGVSGPNTITGEMVRSMSKKAIVFAMANPVPEIMPDEAKKAGAFVVASGRSDFSNQINNVLAFPGVFRAVVKGRLKSINLDMKNAASEAIRKVVKKPGQENIVPDVFYPNLAEIVSRAILKVA